MSTSTINPLRVTYRPNDILRLRIHTIDLDGSPNGMTVILGEQSCYHLEQHALSTAGLKIKRIQYETKQGKVLEKMCLELRTCER